MGGVAATTITSSRMLYRNMAEADINQAVRFLEAQLGRDVRSARTIKIEDGGRLVLRTPAGIVDYFLEEDKDGKLVLSRQDQEGQWKRTMLWNISNVTFTVPEYSMTQVHMRIDAYCKVGGGSDVERTFHSQFTSRVANFYRF